jgi:hypothetical protein
MPIKHPLLARCLVVGRRRGLQAQEDYLAHPQQQHLHHNRKDYSAHRKQHSLLVDFLAQI